jgi:hypothetical protein
MGTAHLGVHFVWHGDLNMRMDSRNLAMAEPVMARLKQVAEGAMRRQRRDTVEYVDAMTYLDKAKLQGPLAASAECHLAHELIWMLGHGHLRKEAVLALSELPLLEQTRSRLRAPGEQDPFGPPLVVVPRTGPAGFSFDPVLNSGVCRMLEVNASALGSKPDAIDWEQLLLWTVLVQIHADLEIYYETGFMRVRKCQRPSCGGWFIAKRMDGRGKFCSPTCRVGNARETAAGAGRPRRRTPRSKEARSSG